ncbi:MAG TPA: 5-amino-6-(D-ribitylamino)uracil--L-tyrosine 4-hydroxyphenyl transferase CofH [Acidimicrobiales bacterium]|jgi:FO synthase|nr:5-amino-6-(D-ribitylamino)uracil--L-tyrosine 4-hydroxyphenyl transferase CofH [Acidimicrobiales bacterium]
MTTLRASATTNELLAASAASLAEAAFHTARAAHGFVVTYSPKVFIPLTKLCRDRCGYCTFAQAPAHVASPYLSLDEVMAIAQAGRDAGCTEALFTLGERPELRYDEAARWLAARGYHSTVDYVASAAQMVLEGTGLLPHANAGALYAHELAQLRSVSASQGMMLETLADVAAHRLAPDKEPQRRLDTLRFAGELKIPFTTGLLVGIGETRQDRVDTLAAIALAHEEFGHVQEVIVQNFLPKARTAMASHPPASEEEFHWTIAVARLLLPDDIHLQAPPNLSDDPARLLDFGIDDFGGISPVTADHVNPERAWPAVSSLASECDKRGFHLTPRLTVYPEFVGERTDFLDEKVRPFVLAQADAHSLARDDTWYSGTDHTPPPPPSSTTRTSDVESLLARYEPGYDFDERELVTLFGARGGDYNAVVDLADGLRQDLVGDAVSFVINRNINYTNVCTFKCRFCAFSKGPLSLNLRGDPYLLTLDEISERVREAEERGATEVCLQGGIHPNFDGDYYIHVVAAVRAGSPSIHIHAFSALEVFEGARRSEQDLATYLTRLKDAGLKTLPGTAAEILDDRIRAVLCPDKINSDQWLEVHRTAHEVGLRSNITIMFGAVEGPESWATHLIRTRDLQKQTGGFTEFVPLPFVHMATPLFLKGRSRKGPTFREAVLMHAVARLHYATLIDNIQVSWVKMGVEGSRRILQAGANDLGGTLMDENISRAAGATHGQEMDVKSLEDLVAPLGRPLHQRSTLYQTL